jgi:hypothetical protein
MFKIHAFLHKYVRHTTWSNLLHLYLKNVAKGLEYIGTVAFWEMCSRSLVGGYWCFSFYMRQHT